MSQEVAPRRRPDSLRLELLPIPEDSVVSATISGDLGAVLERIDVEFDGVSFSSRPIIFASKKKTILHNVSGQFYSGDLTAIMGPSGAGKSTLMNVLAGYTSRGVEGTIFVNGMERNVSEFRRKTCYIMQDDHLQPLLTVQESMFVAANLKLSAKMTPVEKGNRVKEILKAIGLYVHRKTRSGDLSGGQRKRLSIALELIRNPPVLFFDEPTSGLDSSTSKQIVCLLKQLAQEGRTVVCTIHQPSATIFEMFDHLYALSEGRCIYQGSIKGLVPYLQEVGLNCPSYHNPADYLLEVARGDYENDVGILVHKSENGRNEDWRRNLREPTALDSLARVEYMMKNGLMTPVRAPRLHFKDMGTTDCHLSPPGTPTRTAPCFAEEDIYTASFFTQIHVLIMRAYTVLSRDRQLTYTRVATHLFIALIIGSLYFGIGTDATYMLDNFNFLFFTVMFLMFTAFSSMIVAFANELPIVIKEHFNRWYSVKCYLLAVTLADLPVQLFATSLYVVITFFMTSQPFESFRFGLFLGMCFLVSLVAQSIGTLIGASVRLQTGVIFGPLIIMPFVVFSGFFVHMNDAHPYMRWLFSASFVRYGFEGIVHSIFGYGRPKLTCSSDYCHFANPQKLIDQVGMKNAVLSHDVYFLVILLFAIRLCTYCALLIRVGGKR